MKYQISEFDSQNSVELLKEVERLVGRSFTSRLKGVLDNTDYEKVIQRPEGYKYIWNSCKTAITITLEKAKYRDVLGVIAICRKFEKLSENERELLDQITELDKQLLLTKKAHERSLLLSKMLDLLDEAERAIILLQEILSHQELDMLREYEMRIELDTLLSECECRVPEQIDNFKKLIGLGINKENILDRVLQQDLREIELLDIIAYILESDVENEALWNNVVDYLLDTNQYIYLAEKIGLKRIVSKRFINMLVSSYNLLGRYEESIGLLTHLQGQDCPDDDLDYWLIDTYIGSKRYEAAIKLVNEIILRNTSTQRALIKSGDIFRIQGNFRKAIRFYKIAYMASDPNAGKRLFLSYAGAGYKIKAKECFNKLCEEGINRALAKEIYSWVNETNFSDEEWGQYINNKTTRRNNRIGFSNDFDAFVDQLFKMTENINENGLIRTKILRLHGQIKRIKQLLLLEPSDEVAIYHYSRIQSLVHLADFRGQGASKFRLSNVAYVNDPAEGNVISDVLRLVCGVDVANLLLEKLFGNEGTKYRRTYLSSFSRKPDFLPMWVQYANNGSGCCYKIATSQFGRRDYSLERNAIGGNEVRKKSHERSVLYTVHYYQKTTDKLEINNTLEIEENLYEIGKLVASLNVYFNNSQIATMVAGMLDEIRYLFKSSDYETECEVRVIETDFEGSAIVEKTDDTNAPKMYLPLGNELIFDDVILGPKANGIKEWATYLGNCTNIKKVTVSSIQYK